MDSISYMPKIGITDAIEIVIITVIVYYLVSKLKDTRAWILLKGIMFMGIMYVIAYILQFEVIVILFEYVFTLVAIAAVMVLQPEIRKIIEKIGTQNINVPISTLLATIQGKNKKEEKNISDKAVQEIVKGCAIMGKAKTGALIVIENKIPLDDYINTGIQIDAEITSQLLINIFEHNTPLHDGAVVIRENRVTAATCYLPLSDNKSINKDLGTRHRAAIGASENSDALVIVVSEETGKISVAVNGILYHDLDREGLTEAVGQIQETRIIKKNPTDKKVKNVLVYDIQTKLVVFIAAIAIWFVTISSVNPIITRTISGVPVELYNIESITSIDKDYSITSGGKVDIQIKGRKSSVDSISSEDVKARANFNNLSITNAIPIEAYISSGLYDVELTPSESNVIVEIEDVVTVEMPLVVEMVKEPNKHYYISDMLARQSSIVISGGKSVINKIGDVKLEVDASNIRSNTQINVVPKIYDKNGEEINSRKLKLSDKEVEVDITLFETKVVPFKVNVGITNELTKQYAQSVTCETQEITIAGSESDLRRISEITTDIALEIKLKDIMNNKYSKFIDISSVLPEGIHLASDESKAEITVIFSGIKTETVKVDTSNIELRGKSDNVAIEMIDKTVEYSISSVEGKTRSADNPKVYIDMGFTEYASDGIYEEKIIIEDIGENSDIHSAGSVKFRVTHKG